MVKFDILRIYPRVICDPIGVFLVKQKVILTHWGSVRVTERSERLNGDHWSSVELSGG